MKDWIALNMTPGVGPRVTARLLEHFGSAEAIFDAPRRELALLRLTPESIESIANRELHARAEAEIERVRKLGGTTLRSVGHIARLQRLKDNDADYVTPLDMLAELRDDNRQLASSMREMHDLCDEHGDVGRASRRSAASSTRP